jgi:hypothetical protein
MVQQRQTRQPQVRTAYDGSEVSFRVVPFLINPDLMRFPRPPTSHLPPPLYVTTLSAPVVGRRGNVSQRASFKRVELPHAIQ